MRWVTIGAATVVVAGFVASPVSAVAASHAAPTRFAQVSRAPRVPAGARRLGAAKTSNHLSGAVGLAPRNAAALQKAALAVSNPRSKSFHHYIATGQFAQSYGPTAATINSVKAALRAAHLTVTSVSGNGLLVHFSGTVGQAQTAFRTHIASYRLASGRTGIATTTGVSFPASVASQVVGVTGLNTLVTAKSDFRRSTQPATQKAVAPLVTGKAPGPVACSAATAAATSIGGLTDDQVAHAYGVDGLYKASDTGAGQTVAIFELEPFATSDVTPFDQCYFGKTAAAAMASRLTVTTLDGGAGTGEGEGEAILDVQDVSAFAPGANIHVYEAPNTDSALIDEYNEMVSQDTANVISTSWGECEADLVSSDPGSVQLENEIFQQAALQGQTVFSAAGDSGSDDCAEQGPAPVTPTLSTDDPSGQPFVTAVGGTTITDASNPPSEHVWNDGTAAGAGGGGVSSIWGAPSWQQPFLDTAAAEHGVTNGSTACPQSPTGALCREVPDVSALADDLTGSITIYAAEFGGWTTIGGTSSATPLWAAMLADVDATTGAGGCAGSGPIGFASPALYAVASVPNDDKASFNDVTTGNNDIFDLWGGASYKAHAGYDMASGLGTPMLTSPSGGAGLASYLCAMAPAAARPAVTSLAPATESTTPVPLTIGGTGLTGAKAVSIGGYNVPSADWSVVAGNIVVSTVPTPAQASTGGLGPQDGTGRAIVSVTGATGASSIADANSALLYVDGTAVLPVPSVSGVIESGGTMAGGNTVTVFGSGFTGVTGVTVGGVAATGVTVINPTKLTMTVPAYTSGTTTCLGSDDQVNDICQSQVVVTNNNGPSATATIEAPYTGVPFEGTAGGVPIPTCVTGNTCEIVPAASEYDYLVAPSITSITTTSAGDSTVWASEQGTTIATIVGKGFDSLGSPWVNVGPGSVAANQILTLDNVSGTQIQVTLPETNPTTEPVGHQLTVQTMAGISNGSQIRYAGVPKVSGVSPSAVVDTGGTPIVITGKGFQGISNADGGELSYLYVQIPFSTDQHGGYTATSDTSISATTPSNDPGVFITTVCTITFCSGPTSESSFDNSLIDFFQPGNPVITSVSARSGPASGGTKVVITGKNLSDVVAVKFGKTPAQASNAEQLLTNGSSAVIDAVAPPGKAGSKVAITVSTVESVVQGAPSAKSTAATFAYKVSPPSAPQDVAGKVHGTSLRVTWKPPASNGGHAVTRYRVGVVALPDSPKKGAKKPPTISLLTKNGKARSTTVTGLRAGWDYIAKVQAINSKGRGLVGKTQRVFFIHQSA